MTTEVSRDTTSNTRGSGPNHLGYLLKKKFFKHFKPFLSISKKHLGNRTTNKQGFIYFYVFLSILKKKIKLTLEL